MITVELAGVVIGLDNKYRYTEELCKDYIVSKSPDFVVYATDSEICEEREASETDYSPGYLESIVLYRKIAEQLPFYDAFVFHGAAIVFDGEAYAFTAKSGVGKTTHTRLWQKYYGERVHYLNGDKPIIRFFSGKPYICGTPYMGKEGYGRNETKRLCALSFVNRGEENRVDKIAPSDAVERILSQIYMPKNKEALVRMMSLVNELLESIDLFMLYCNMDIEAARVAKEAIVCSRRSD